MGCSAAAAAEPERVRVGFLGNAPASLPSLRALAGSSHDLAAVVTRVPRPAGRGHDLRPTPVAEAARTLGLEPVEVETVKTGEGFDALAAAELDVLAVVAYGEILPRAVLDLPSVAPVNVHFSLLPELRGAAPVERAILAGMIATGVTTIRMDEGMDTGPILLQATEPIHPADTGGALRERLAAVGARLLVDTLDRLESGAIQGSPQDHARATFAPRIERHERIIDWSEGADAVVRRVRAFAPTPGATTAFRRRVLKVLAAAGAAAGDAAVALPGTVVDASPHEGPVIAAGDGVVRLLEVGPEGRSLMTGAEFVRGYRLTSGDRLG